MGVFETTIIYTIIGLVMAAAMALSARATSMVTKAGLFPLHTVLWPFFAPVLLGRAVDRGDPDTEKRDTKRAARAVADPRIRDAEAQLLSALSRVGGIAEELLGPQMESVRNLSDSLGRMDARLTEMDALLASREFDRQAAEQALRELLDSPDIDNDDARIESVQARLRNIERLHHMRERARRDLQRAILKMEEMNSQILLLQFADRPEGEIAESIQDIAATIDGLSEGLLVV